MSSNLLNRDRCIQNKKFVKTVDVQKFVKIAQICSDDAKQPSEQAIPPCTICNIPCSAEALTVSGPSSGNGWAASAVVLIHAPFAYGPVMNRPPVCRVPILGPVTKLPQFRKAGPARRRMLRLPRLLSLTRREEAPTGNNAHAAHGAIQVPESRQLTGLVLIWGPLFVRFECQLRQGPAGCFANFICGGGTPLPTKWTESFGQLGSLMRSFDLSLRLLIRVGSAVSGSVRVLTA